MRSLVAALALLISFSTLAEAKVINRGVVLDPKGFVRSELIRDALAVLKSRSGLRKDRVAIVDFSKHSGEKRFFLIDLRTGDVEAYRTAHGKGSDSNHDGMADSFSNSFNSKASSLGSYAARGEYFGKYGLSLKLDGLDKSNRNASGRKIVLHSADYATPDWLKRHGRLGRSFGCFVVDPTLVRHIVKKLKGGVLIYAAR
jgi:hypothetical protein